MSNDIAEGNWKQLKGKVRENWGKLTDDEVDEIRGRKENFVGKIQEKYGLKKMRQKESGIISINNPIQPPVLQPAFRLSDGGLLCAR